MGGGEVRVSLTGEVMEVPQPTPRATSPGAPGPRVGPGPGPAPGPAPRRPAGPGAPRVRGGMEYDETQKKGNPAGIVFLVLLLLIGGGFGGWWWYQKQNGPTRAAEQMVTFVNNNDWKGLFHMVQLPPEQQQRIDAAGGMDAVASQIESLMKMTNTSLKVTDHKIGNVKVSGNTATVDVTMTINGSGPTGSMNKTNTETVAFVRVNGEWKIDGSKTNNGGMAGNPFGGIGGGMGAFGSPGGAGARGGAGR